MLLKFRRPGPLPEGDMLRRYGGDIFQRCPDCVAVLMRSTLDGGTVFERTFLQRLYNADLKMLSGAVLNER